MNKIELLAPAGNFECLIAAVQCGADAIYLSGKGFGARSFADNFNSEELEKAMDYCHLRGVKVYVTVNTLVADREFDELCTYLRFLNRIGTDAIIVQDFGVLEIAKRVVPDLPVHASTQMTVHNADGVKALEKQGIKRVVLSREISLENLELIKKETNAELEVFGHGALCMCFSGQCLMSSIIGGRSGNRGKCAQPCRLPYSINDGSKKAFYMSLKDLCSLKYIDKMQGLGITSLKIEGRMKGPLYVAAVVKTYRKYIDNPGEVDEADIRLLDSIFNRGGLTDGYLTGKKGPQMFAFDKPDNPYLKETEIITEELSEFIKSENKKIRVDCHIKIKFGMKPEIYIENKDFGVEYQGECEVQQAQNNPLDKEKILLSINKTGGTPFEFSEISIDIDEGVFLPKSELNALRRNVFELFEKGYTKTFKRKHTDMSETDEISEFKPESTEFICEITKIEQFDAVKAFTFRFFFIPYHLILKNREIFDVVKEKVIVVLPAVMHQNERASIAETVKQLLNDGYFAVQANNIADTVTFAEYNMVGGFRLNIFNSFALSFLKKQGIISAELSPELNFRQISAIKKSIPVQIMVYGRLPLMVAENCIIKNSGKCPCNGKNSITDRIGMTFPVVKDGDACRSVVLNCKKTFLAAYMDKICKTGVNYLRMYFTDESPTECLKVCESFLNGTGYRPDDFTTGHFDKTLK